MKLVSPVYTTLTIRVEPDLLRRFKVVAVQQDKSMSVILREFLSWYVEKEESRERV